MSETSIHDIAPREREMLLTSMAESPAFALLCDRWDELVAKEVDAKIFDTETSDADTRELKRVRKQLTDSRHPRKILQSMIQTASAQKNQPTPKP